MKLFLNIETNEIFAYEEDGSQDHLISGLLKPISKEEADQIILTKLVQSPVQVPQVVTIRQAKLALLQVGLLDDVDAAVAQSDRATQIEWEYATEVRRTWSTLLTLQTALGLSDAQIDDLFILAAEL